jgi:hypothetical protein
VSRTRIFLNADSRFHEENRAAKGKLKIRAMRALAVRTKEALEEVNDPNCADVHFDILQQPGSKAWMLHKSKRSAE